jgi:hypothetical protein
MTSWIQKTFHTDKWWGKIIFVVSLYIIYWTLCYLVVPFIILAIQGYNFGGVFFFVFLFLIAPLLSFEIPIIIKRSFVINKFFLYIGHVFLAIIVPFVSMLLFFGYMFSQIHIGGF